MKTVVIAVTNTKQSEVAVQFAVDELLKAAHTVHLLHVVEPPIEPSYYFTASAAALYSADYLEEVQRKAMKDAADLLHHVKQQITAKLPVQVEMVVGKGEARDEIVDYCARVKADALVIGARGLGALKRTFLGSVSDYCAHNVDCPILIIKSKK